MWASIRSPSTVLDNLPQFASLAGAPRAGKLYQCVAVQIYDQPVRDKRKTR
jgi:hypothetical protein